MRTPRYRTGSSAPPFPRDRKPSRSSACWRTAAARCRCGPSRPRSTSRHTRLELMLKVLEVEGAVERVGGGWLRTLRAWAYDDERVAAGYGRTSGRAGGDARLRLDGRLPDGVPAHVSSTTRRPVPVGYAIGVVPGRSMFRWTLSWLPTRRRSSDTDPSSWNRANNGPASARREATSPTSCATGPAGRSAPTTTAAGAPSSRRRRRRHSAYPMSSSRPRPSWCDVGSRTRRQGGSPMCRPRRHRPGARLRRTARSPTGLPVVDVIRRVRDGRPQKEMENSAQQFRNVYGAFEVVGPVPEAPGPADR